MQVNFKLLEVLKLSSIDGRGLIFLLIWEVKIKRDCLVTMGRKDFNSVSLASRVKGLSLGAEKCYLLRKRQEFGFGSKKSWTLIVQTRDKFISKDALIMMFSKAINFQWFVRREKRVGVSAVWTSVQFEIEKTFSYELFISVLLRQK